MSAIRQLYRIDSGSSSRFSLDRPLLQGWKRKAGSRQLRDGYFDGESAGGAAVLASSVDESLPSSRSRESRNDASSEDGIGSPGACRACAASGFTKVPLRFRR
jgi:hypothetical protein